MATITLTLHFLFGQPSDLNPEILPSIKDVYKSILIVKQYLNQTRPGKWFKRKAYLTTADLTIFNVISLSLLRPSNAG
uniref:Uncharacterized protein n=1 Tax=Lepeophtheirus salmonis TaxID=72036 RepID=A0A0K2VET2_LEPSM